VTLLLFAASLTVWTATAAITFPPQVRWSAALPASPAFAPAFDEVYAYFPLRNDELVALKLDDGSKAWSVECPMTAPPAAGEGSLFVGRDGQIQGRARNDGGLQWGRTVAGRIVSLHWNTGWLLASSEHGHLIALRGTDGEILWQHDLQSPLSGPPAIAGDRLHVPLKDGRIVAMGLQDGQQIWTHKLTDAAVGIAAFADKVFVGGRDNQFHALGAEDGDTHWRWPTGADLLGLPAVDNRRVYFIALDNVLRGHHRNNGSMLWKRVLPMRPFTGPILVGDTLIVSGVASELRAYNVLDGKPAGEFTVKGAENEEMLLAAAPHLTASGVIVLITKGGQVRAVHSPPAAPPAETKPTPDAPPPTDAVPEADGVAAPGPATLAQP
jgi:outer membrane protein assembly factor BamB